MTTQLDNKDDVALWGDIIDFYVMLDGSLDAEQNVDRILTLVPDLGVYRAEILPQIADSLVRNVQDVNNMVEVFSGDEADVSALGKRANSLGIPFLAQWRGSRVRYLSNINKMP